MRQFIIHLLITIPTGVLNIRQITIQSQVRLCLFSILIAWKKYHNNQKVAQVYLLFVYFLFINLIVAIIQLIVGDYNSWQNMH